MSAQNPIVSILMSLYNEPKNQIYSAVNSILKQTYSNFELIIINDNPENLELKKISSQISKIDNRIKVIHNKKNLGLALSMNKAANLAKGKYLARMDADDVAHEKRIQLEVNQMDQGIDFVYTNCTFINEDGEELNIENLFRNAQIAKKILPLKNCISHSSIMITTKLFNKLGGYRNFPCSQDYDLWLRVIGSDAKISAISQKLMFYRIRSNSISATMPMKQDLTASYIKELYRERKNNKNCIDNFSVAHYQEYLSKNGFGNKRNEQSYIKYKNLKNSSREKFTKHHKITGLIGYTWAFLRNKLVRQSIITDWKIRKAVKSLNS